MTGAPHGRDMPVKTKTMADTIGKFPSRLHKMTKVFYREVPSQAEARRFIDDLTNLLFPVRAGRGMSLRELDLRWENLQKDYRQEQVYDVIELNRD